MYEREMHIDAAPETVFSFFTDPERMKQWKGTDAKLDPVPGGAYWVNVTGEDIAVGEYLEVEAPTRVVYSWGWEGGEGGLAPGTSRIEVTLRPDGAGTLLRFVHSDLPVDAEASHGQGWDHYLARLEIAAGGGDPGVDDWIKS